MQCPSCLAEVTTLCQAASTRGRAGRELDQCIDRPRHAAHRPRSAGNEIDVEIYGERFWAVVQDERPLWDPQNERFGA